MPRIEVPDSVWDVEVAQEWDWRESVCTSATATLNFLGAPVLTQSWTAADFPPNTWDDVEDWVRGQFAGRVAAALRAALALDQEAGAG